MLSYTDILTYAVSYADILSSSSSTHVHSFSLDPTHQMQILLVVKAKEHLYLVRQA
jgi:hypothetical protein